MTASSHITSRRREIKSRIAQIQAEHVASGKELQRAMEEWVELAHEDGLLAFLAALFNCYQRLVQRTPVDTGRARAGWHIEAQEDEWAPDEKDFPRTKKEPYSTLPPLSPKEREAISREVGKLPALTRADVIYVMSNIKYILPLEAGLSKQSSGFWALFMEELKSQLEQAAQNSRRGTP